MQNEKQSPQKSVVITLKPACDYKFLLALPVENPCKGRTEVEPKIFAEHD